MTVSPSQWPTHQHLLRSLDALMDHQEAVDDVVASLLRPLVDQDLSLPSSTVNSGFRHFRPQALYINQALT
jgi:hypothetical protein